MADDIFKWIRNVSALNDEQLKQENDLVHQSSVKAFARALFKVRRPEVDTHTLRNGTLTEHNFADTINLLLSIGENQKYFNDYTTKHFNWKYAMFHLYIVYYRFLNDYPMFVYSGLPWTTIRNECTKWRRWLDSDEAKTLSTDNYSSSSFWKGTLPPYRELIDNDDNSIASPNSFHSIEDDGERDDNQSTQDDMILSGSIVNLNILKSRFELSCLLLQSYG